MGTPLVSDVRRRVQRRTMGALAASQVLGGMGAFTAIAITTLLAQNITGSERVSGLPQTGRELGAAVAAYAIARISAARGRRAGLATGYALCVLGSVLCVAAGVFVSFGCLLVGMVLVGGGLASTWQARFAATDLAAPDRRGRALSIVVWATAIGAIVGPALVGPAGHAAQAIGLPPLTGGFVVAAVAAAVAMAWVMIRMRPDPLLVARTLEHAPSPSSSPARRGAVAVMRQYPRAAIGVAAIAAAHTTMVSVMVMAPLQMHSTGAGLRLIGLVISVHMAGMYALSPVIGWCTDTVGPRSMLAAGATLLLTAVVLTGAAGRSVPQLTLGLGLIGLGWSCTLIAASAALTAELPHPEDRPVGQGLSDLIMGAAGGAGGALAGLIVGTWGFAALNAFAALSVVVVAAAAIAAGPAGHRRDEASASTNQRTGPGPTGPDSRAPGSSA